MQEADCESDPPITMNLLIGKQDLNCPAQALKPLLEALTLSSLSERSETADVPKTDSGGKGLVALHLLAIVMLADIEIQFKAPRKGELQLELVWPRVCHIHSSNSLF